MGIANEIRYRIRKAFLNFKRPQILLIGEHHTDHISHLREIEIISELKPEAVFLEGYDPRRKGVFERLSREMREYVRTEYGIEPERFSKRIILNTDDAYDYIEKHAYNGTPYENLFYISRGISSYDLKGDKTLPLLLSIPDESRILPLEGEAIYRRREGEKIPLDEVDKDMAQNISSYVSSSEYNGGTVVVILGKSHMNGVYERLKIQGYDVWKVDVSTGSDMDKAYVRAVEKTFGNR